MYSAVHHRLDKHRELNEIYWAWSLKSFGLSFVSIFLPIYLYELGFSITQVFIYFLMFHGMRIFIEPFSGWLVAKFGPKHIMAASFYLLLIQLALFLTLPQVGWPLWFISFVTALGLSMHFVSLHTDFSEAKSTKEVGKELSRLNELANLGSAVGPLVGGIIATYVGIQFSFAAALVILSLAVLPLFRTTEIKPAQAFDMRRIRLRPIARDMLSNVGSGIDAVLVNFLWPFIIFLIVGTYANVGAITTVALLMTLFVSSIVGRLLDKGHWQALMRTGSVGAATVHVLRIFAMTPASAIVTSILGDMAHWFANIPYLAAYYEHADRPGRIEYVVMMQIATEVGRTFFWLVLVLISMTSTNNAIVAACLMGSAGALLMMVIRPTKQRKLT